jgi:hypothetical protein
MAAAPPRLALLPGVVFALGPPLAVLSIGGEPFDLVWPACAVLGLEVVWVVWSWRRASGGLFDPYLLFFASTLLFNGGQVLIAIFGLEENGILEGVYPPSELTATIAFVVSALGALHLGALLAVRQRAPGLRPVAPADAKPLYLTGLLLGAIAIVPLLVRVTTAMRLVLSDGYKALYRDAAPVGVDSALVILEVLILPAALLLIAARRGRLLGAWLPWCVLFAYAGSLLFLGYRANAVFPLIAALWLWSRMVKAVRAVPIAAAAAVLLLVVFPVVRKTREVRASDRASVSFLKDALDDVERPFLSVLTEMGGSMRTVTETLRLVPGSHPYELGEGYAYALLTAMPSLFWDRHPTIARGTPGVWLTEQVDPVQAALGGSLGYSVIAETWLNFGAAGPLVLLLLGFALVKCWCWAEDRGGAALVLVASFLPMLLFLARSSSSEMVRPVFWYGLGPYGVVRLLGSLSSRRTRSRAALA